MTEKQFTELVQKYLQCAKEQSEQGAVILHRFRNNGFQVTDGKSISPKESTFLAGDGNLWVRYDPAYIKNLRLTYAEAYDDLQDNLQAFGCIPLTPRQQETK